MPRSPLLRFFLLACGLTWIFATPLALAWVRHVEPPPYAIPMAGLSAFGPLVAALVVGGRAPFRGWRAHPAWILGALFVPMLTHLVATAIFVAFGGHPTQWLHPPRAPEAIAALVVFPLGEEIGWRGFAHPRAVARWGLVGGSLVVGLVWGLWHLVYASTPTNGIDLHGFALGMVTLPLFSLPIAWVFERTGRSLGVAVAFHAGAHIDHFEAAADVGPTLRGIHVGVVAILAFVSARALSKLPPPR